jgi:hypothetical protein
VKLELKNIVWTAVVATVASTAGLIGALAGLNTNTVLALAGIAITSALLSQREK